MPYSRPKPAKTPKKAQKAGQKGKTGRDLTSHPANPRNLVDNEVHSQISGMLRGVGENFT